MAVACGSIAICCVLLVFQLTSRFHIIACHVAINLTKITSEIAAIFCSTISKDVSCVLQCGKVCCVHLVFTGEGQKKNKFLLRCKWSVWHVEEYKNRAVSDIIGVINVSVVYTCDKCFREETLKYLWATFLLPAFADCSERIYIYIRTCAVGWLVWRRYQFGWTKNSTGPTHVNCGS